MATATPKNETTDSFLKKAANTARFNLWKFVGALVMEEKNGVQAVSLTKLLALTTYGACMLLWLGLVGSEVDAEVKTALEAAKIDVPSALKAASEIPDSLIYTLWGLLGINGGSKIAGTLKKGTPNG